MMFDLIFNINYTIPQLNQHSIKVIREHKNVLTNSFDILEIVETEETITIPYTEYFEVGGKRQGRLTSTTWTKFEVTVKGYPVEDEEDTDNVNIEDTEDEVEVEEITFTFPIFADSLEHVNKQLAALPTAEVSQCAGRCV